MGSADAAVVLCHEVLIAGAEQNDEIDKGDDGGDVGPAEQKHQNAMCSLAQVKFVDTETAQQECQHGSDRPALDGQVGVGLVVVDILLIHRGLMVHGRLLIHRGLLVHRLGRSCRLRYRNGSTTVFALSGGVVIDRSAAIGTIGLHNSLLSFLKLSCLFYHEFCKMQQEI